jgi:hypothetical protein
MIIAALVYIAGSKPSGPLDCWGIGEMFGGYKINETENRAVMHAALQCIAETMFLANGHDVIPDVGQIIALMANTPPF